MTIKWTEQEVELIVSALNARAANRRDDTAITLRRLARQLQMLQRGYSHNEETDHGQANHPAHAGTGGARAAR